MSAYAFGDTVIVVAESDADPAELLNRMANRLIERFIENMRNGFLFRGAVEHGEFYETANPTGLFGAAPFGAAALYDKTDWAGFVLGPVATRAMEGWARETGYDPVAAHGWWTRQVVPWKRGFDPGFGPNWCLAWPRPGPLEGPDDVPALTTAFGPDPLPPEVLRKRENTLAFYNEHAGRHREAFRRAFERAKR